jgi:hypothetical protein
LARLGLGLRRIRKVRKVYEGLGEKYIFKKYVFYRTGIFYFKFVEKKFLKLKNGLWAAKLAAFSMRYFSENIY